ncbi:glycosyltransferase family 2 protein [Acinetobacter bereziniae]|uniref:glycosyltransferase family 2 protein n=1 Tax=Acinetobacter bereziniae TaxID=106648 RepID=UPI0029550D37|nr:glycosyltransferase family 2 protein [Acinetobacter bereziniae]MDV8157307.1 glycosyltransferase family 2 protein [Acinetobacter bereziniae]
MNNLVSILVPVYNVESFIAKCAKSLFEQTYKNIEYIFVDDCSPDCSVEILENIKSEYPDRIKYIKIIKHEINKGLAGARNTAILNALGDYILHVDSDDFIEKETVEKLVNNALEEQADIVVFDYYLEWEKVNKLIVHKYDTDKEKYLDLVLSAQTENFVVNKLIKRSLYVDYKILHTQGLNFGEDYLVVPKLLFFSQKISKVNEAFYHYIRFNNNSYTSSISKKNIEDLIFVYHELEKFLIKVDCDRSSLFQGCLTKKFELIRDSMSVEKFKYIKENFVIDQQELFMNNMSGIKYLMLKLLENSEYFKLLLLTKTYKFLVNLIQVVKRR